METPQGLSISTHSTEVIDEINHFQQQLLGMGPSADAILVAAKKHPDNVMIQIYCAIFYLYAQEDAATRLASDYLFQAEKHLSSANLREKLTYYATTAWLGLDYENAITLFTSLCTLFPRDIIALKCAEFLFYCTGQAHKARPFLTLCKNSLKDNQNDPYFLSIYSFSLELSGQLQQAIDVSEKAIAINQVNPWAHHTLAHAFLLNHQIEEGIKRLQQLQPTWGNCLSLIRGHNTWHLALFHLANCDEANVMALYPDIFGTLPDTVMEQIDATSLLWRMDMAGLPQDDELKSVVSQYGAHSNENYMGFINAHLVYGLTKSGETSKATDALTRITTYANTLPRGCHQDLWLHVNIPLCQGVHAFAQKDYKTAFERMQPAIDKRLQIGGSDAQNELFAQTYLLCLLKTQQHDVAKQFSATHLAHYQNTALENAWYHYD